MAGSLSWSLVVATYNRRHILPRCLRLAATQTRPPLEIIVVDSSPDWTTTRDLVLQELAVQHPAIRWEYVQAHRRSGTVQRNQGIRLSSADIVFLIDDDSLMYPDCAAEILRIYEADPEEKVAGVMGAAAATPPDVPAAAVVEQAPPPKQRFQALRRFKDWMLQKMGIRDYLLPYDAPAREHTLPEGLRGLPIVPMQRLYGAWMTCRRRMMELEPFDEILDAYSYLEDSDVSYRLGRRGLLLLALDARMCHLQDPSGRLSKFTLATLGALNAVVLHRLHSSDVQRSRRLYRPFLRKRVVVEALRDLAKRQWSLPQARGILLALRRFPKVFNSSEQELRQWYPQFQLELLGRDTKSGKQRLGYLVPEFPSQTHAFFWREIEALRGMGVQVSLFSSRRPAPGSCRHDFAETATSQTHYLFPPRWGACFLALALRPIRTVRGLAYVAGLRQSSLKRRLIYTGMLFPAADLMLSSRERNLTHVHAHSCADAAHVVALAHLLGGPPYSLTLHGDLPVYGVDHASKMKGAQFVACVTTPLQRQVVEQVGLPVERAPVLWMGVETERFRAGDSRSYLPRKLHMVTVARLNPMKGHHHALAAMKLARARGCDIRYTIAGEGPHRQEIEADIQGLGLGESVHMAGTLSEGAVLEVLQQADVFVLPSVGLGEAAPVSVMEAMACGLPVICSIIGGTPDMISSGVDGILIKQGDEQALADALVALAEDVQERRQLGQRARDRALQSFDVRNTARRLLEAIYPESTRSTADSTGKTG